MERRRLVERFFDLAIGVCLAVALGLLLLMMTAYNASA